MWRGKSRENDRHKNAYTTRNKQTLIRLTNRKTKPLIQREKKKHTLTHRFIIMCTHK